MPNDCKINGICIALMPNPCKINGICKVVMPNDCKNSGICIAVMPNDWKSNGICIALILNPCKCTDPATQSAEQQMADDKTPLLERERCEKFRSQIMTRV